MGPKNIYNFTVIIIPTFLLLDGRVVRHSFFGLSSIWTISFGFGHRTCCFYYEIATPTSDKGYKMMIASHQILLEFSHGGTLVCRLAQDLAIQVQTPAGAKIFMIFLFSFGLEFVLLFQSKYERHCVYIS